MHGILHKCPACLSWTMPLSWSWDKAMRAVRRLRNVILLDVILDQQQDTSRVRPSARSPARVTKNIWLQNIEHAETEVQNSRTWPTLYYEEHMKDNQSKGILVESSQKRKQRSSLVKHFRDIVAHFFNADLDTAGDFMFSSCCLPVWCAISKDDDAQGRDAFLLQWVCRPMCSC